MSQPNTPGQLWLENICPDGQHGTLVIPLPLGVRAGFISDEQRLRWHTHRLGGFVLALQRASGWEIIMAFIIFRVLILL